MLFHSTTSAIAFDGQGWDEISQEYLDELVGLTSLKALYARKNNITAIPDLNQFESLEVVDFSDQSTPIEHIDELTDSLNRLPRLKHLRVTIADPTDEETIFQELPGLQTLNDKPRTKFVPGFRFQPESAPPSAEVQPGRIRACVGDEWTVLYHHAQDRTAMLSKSFFGADSKPEFMATPDYKGTASFFASDEEGEDSSPGFKGIPEPEAMDEAAYDEYLKREYEGEGREDIEPLTRDRVNADRAEPDSTEEPEQALYSDAESDDFPELLDLSDWEAHDPADPEAVATHQAAIDQISDIGTILPDGPHTAESTLEHAAARHAAIDTQPETILAGQAATVSRLGRVAAHNIYPTDPLLALFIERLALHSSHVAMELHELVGETRQAGQAQVQELMRASELLMQEIETHGAEKRRIVEEYEEDRRKMIEELGKVKSENERLSVRIKTLESKPKPTTLGAKPKPTPHSTRPPSVRGLRTNDQQKGTTEPGQIRYLSDRQVTDFIQSVMRSKTEYDEKVKTHGLPPETLQEHLFSYLNHRYGLRQLVMDWAASLRHALRQREKTDIECKLFLKMLRNDIDESFYSVVQDLKQSIAELLANVIANKFDHRGRHDPAVESKLQSRLKGLVPDDEWVEVVRAMYGHDDCLALIATLKGRSKAATGPANQGKHVIPFAQFISTVLEFQMLGHDRYLMKFRTLFRQFDQDGDGALTTDQFGHFISTVSPDVTQAEVLKFIEASGARQHDKVTFSKAVEVLSTELRALKA
ncbi:EF-hand domain [Carpediemonas membranifera]|uniref:EF-hand domain n=1 Tax=Carpediemonas membranifera TaxID=201153 RepID=A0A8J6E2Y9_9EUKA|nr:EF-hand domain [Carpediemonas membranifera]|eukprot:KAG9392482.1 EF-hand domain [Carpediemonas membranifera]